jgi:hypothetical protein
MRFVLLEEDIQIMLVEQIRLTNPRTLFWHTPNSGKVQPQYRRKLLQLGMLSGVPDLLFFTRPAQALKRLGKRIDVDFEEVVGAALELKREGEDLRKEQIDVLNELDELGWATDSACGYEEAMRKLRRWGYVR